jgi:hypothetical protein
MTLSRRRFLQLTSAGLVTAPLGCAGPRPAGPAVLDKVLNSYIDTLLPTDTAPGALQLDVPVKVRALLQRKRALQAVYQAGAGWLETRAQDLYGSSFASRTLAERDAVVQQLSEQTDALLARFFHKSLHHVRMFYYSNPRAWQALGLTGTPQPAGFMDYMHAPRPHG